MYLICICTLLLEKRILLDFLSFCVDTFLMLQTLLPEVFSVVSFRVCK